VEKKIRPIALSVGRRGGLERRRGGSLGGVGDVLGGLGGLEKGRKKLQLKLRRVVTPIPQPRGKTRHKKTTSNRKKLKLHVMSIHLQEPKYPRDLQLPDSSERGYRQSNKQQGQSSRITGGNSKLRRRKGD